MYPTTAISQTTLLVALLNFLIFPTLVTLELIRVVLDFHIHRLRGPSSMLRLRHYLHGPSRPQPLVSGRPPLSEALGAVVVRVTCILWLHINHFEVKPTFDTKRSTF